MKDGAGTKQLDGRERLTAPFATLIAATAAVFLCRFMAGDLEWPVVVVFASVSAAATLSSSLLLRRQTSTAQWLLAPVSFLLGLLSIAVMAVAHGASLWPAFLQQELWVPLSAASLGGLALWRGSERGRRLKKVANTSFHTAFVGVVLATIFLAAAWRVPPTAATWEDASPEECPLIAAALREALGARTYPLVASSADAAPCDWMALGSAGGRITRSQYDAQRGQSGYVPHAQASDVRYSSLGVRAAVSVGVHSHTLSGMGSVCYFRRGVKGWRLQQCNATWMS